MRIGELEIRSGASRHTLRYYERIGLLQARRRANNYREYDEQAVAELAFIRQAQTMGFALEEVRELLAARRNRQLDCARGAALIADKLVALDARLDELNQLRERLRTERERLLLSAARSGVDCGAAS
ncbi:MAG TPA: MerR family transcriptional regulator [Pseudomonas sp.]|uniref:MerR family transcriptional regulator n=1 Tax=Pseudomonas sp. TaxID=306 RepID=UPI002C6DB088|nr:MerR family transcriptional regulator [Pseudomonas sp.]HTO20051.1 MerR family transcriptional regulator [Pseudomonas sp.]